MHAFIGPIESIFNFIKNRLNIESNYLYEFFHLILDSKWTLANISSVCYLITLKGYVYYYVSTILLTIQ